METIIDLLNEAKKRTSSASDSALARHLKLSRGAVSNWRTGVSQPDTVTCAKIAEITGIPLARVLGIVGEARAISREEKAVWRRLASAAIVVLSLLPMVPVSATVRPALTEAAYMHYAK